jgi:hypothetical protein
VTDAQRNAISERIGELLTQLHEDGLIDSSGDCEYVARVLYSFGNYSVFAALGIDAAESDGDMGAITELCDEFIVSATKLAASRHGAAVLDRLDHAALAANRDSNRHVKGPS